MLHNADIQMICGLTGSGKSYHCVRWMIDFVVTERRPVYTNQPMRWKELRAFLTAKHGPEIAHLIRPLTHSLFENFMERVTKQATFLRELREELANIASPLLEDEEALHEHEHAAWLEHAGEDVWVTTYGEDGARANTIPPTACILIDELHEWYPSKTYQGKKGEEKWVLDYMTMHRHTMHKLIFATQRPMQISHTIRNLAHKWTYCVNRKDQRLAWCITFGHIGAIFPSWKTIIGVEKYPASDIDESGAPKMGARPIHHGTIIASLPHNLWPFGLYDSHSRLGSEKFIMKALAQVREQAGLDPDGLTPQEVAEKKELERKQGKFMYKTMSLLYRFLKKATVLLVLLGIGFGVGRISARGWGMLDTDQTDQLAQEPPVEQDPYANWLPLTSIGTDFVRLGSDRVSIGTDYHGHTLQSIARRSRGVLWIHDGSYLVQRVGDSRPTLLGPASEIRARLGADLAPTPEPEQ